MLEVITVAQASEILAEHFNRDGCLQELPLDKVCGLYSGAEIRADKYVPGYHRSMVDGYAVRAADTFGAGEVIPAMLKLGGSVDMGCLPQKGLEAKECYAVPTGGGLPEGADAMVMVEDTQRFPDGTVCIYKAAAPGNYVVYRGDDMKPGKIILKKDTMIGARQIGALAAMGIVTVPVRRRFRVGVISTGDELISCGQPHKDGKIWDVNGPLLISALQELHIVAVSYGIVPDSEEQLETVLCTALKECDAVLLSGGTSVGEKDSAERILGRLGVLLWHGLAVRPGKPTLAADIGGKPVFALPGHPMAAYFMWLLLARPMFRQWLGEEERVAAAAYPMGERISSNHGRETLMPVTLQGGYAWPVRGKSGLITTLLNADGYLRIARDCEGIEAGQETTVYRFGEGEKRHGISVFE